MVTSHKEYNPQPVFSHVEPVLAVRDVSETISYWHDTLSFPNKWIWGNPPTHGGVSSNGAFVQFSFNPELAAASQGNSIWFRVSQVETLYALHRKKNAEIIAPLENKPWGMAEYTVREINGYFIHFAAPVSDRQPRPISNSLPVRIIARSPAVKEYRNLVSAVGWTTFADDAMVKLLLSAAVFALVAEDTEKAEVVGCALLLGDNASFYYVKDLIVRPDWQGKDIGTALMKELIHWLENNVQDKAMVGLYTGETLAPFYRQFGFTPAFGMNLWIRAANLLEKE